MLFENLIVLSEIFTPGKPTLVAGGRLLICWDLSPLEVRFLPLELIKKEIPTKEILIKDREHLTLKEISNKYNIASSTLWYRLNN